MTIRTPRSISEILLESPLASTRLLIAMSSLTWAFLLLLPADTFAPGRTTYALMARVAPEEAWAIAFLVHGVWALFTLRTGTRNRVTLAMDAFLGCVLWTGSTLLCFAAHWPFQVEGGFFDQLIHYPVPAAMSGEWWVAVASWWHLVRYWAEEDK